MQDLSELPDEVRRDVKFVPATTLEDVLKVALPEAVTATTAPPPAGSASGEAAAAASTHR